MANDIESFFQNNGHALTPSSKTRYAKHPPKNGPHCALMLTYDEKHLIPFLEKAKASRDLLGRVRDALSGADEADVPLPKIDLTTRGSPRVIAAQLDRPIPPSEITRVALQHLFGITNRHYSLVTGLDGDYFCYRLSANDGEIVRTHLHVENLLDEGILRFENWHRRGGKNWIVRGFGIVVEAITYLFGHAVAETDPNKGLGLRSYALLNFESYGWFVGTVTSTYDSQNPIAARVVVIPAEQHKTFKTMKPEISDADRRDIVKKMIEQKVTKNNFDQEFNFDGEAPEIPWFTQLQCLIWNASFTTIRGKPDELDNNWLRQYELLFELQRRAIGITRQTGPSTPFLLFAENMDSFMPDDYRLETAIRRPYNDTSTEKD
ncbi:hypothetical protein [Bradyrhizobium genosp. A]|uniref:hypothetical protein n=1 Tax=Bradyrhizobium genosp. A TaxID=83626 RepID=UPI003CFAF799